MTEGVLIGCIVITILMLVRNQAVYSERIRVLDNEPIDDALAWHKSVGYYEMFLKVWKPVKSFYPDWRESR